MVIDVVPNDHDWWFFPAISGLEVHLEKVKKPKTELLYHFVNLNYYCEHRNIPSNYFTTDNMTPPSERHQSAESHVIRVFESRDDYWTTGDYCRRLFTKHLLFNTR